MLRQMVETCQVSRDSTRESLQKQSVATPVPVPMIMDST